MKLSPLYLGWPIGGGDKSIRSLYAQKYISKQRRLRTRVEDAIEYRGDGHLLTIAPTGTGKGVSTIVPCLLTCTDSIIVLDPKGENFHITARRRLELGQQVHVLDPFGVVTPKKISYRYNGKRVDRQFHSDSLNPLDYTLYSNRNLDAEAQRIATSLQEKSGDNAWWDNMALLLMSSIIHFVATSGHLPSHKRNFSTVVDLIARDHLGQYLADILKYRSVDRFTSRGFTSFASIVEQKQQDSVQQFAAAYMATLSDGSVDASLRSSTIDVMALRRGEPVTIYIVFPASKMVSHVKLLRLWVTVLLAVMQSRRERPGRSTLFLLDECAQLGELEELRTVVTLLRGYGVRAWMFFQDLAQIERNYRQDWRNIINNCAVVQAFGLGRMNTAKPMEELLGEVSASEMIGFGRDQQVISKSGRPVQIAELMRYWQDEAFRGLYDKN